MPLHVVPYGDRTSIQDALFCAKHEKKLSFQEIADALGRTDVWVASVFFQKNAPSHDDALKLIKILGLDRDKAYAQGDH